MRWILYSRSDCPLCEYAANLLRAAAVEFREVDIDTDVRLKQQYDLQVPVIADTITGQELAFPFEPEQVLAFVKVSNEGAA